MNTLPFCLLYGKLIAKFDGKEMAFISTFLITTGRLLLGRTVSVQYHMSLSIIIHLYYGEVAPWLIQITNDCREQPYNIVLFLFRIREKLCSSDQPISQVTLHDIVARCPNTVSTHCMGQLLIQVSVKVVVCSLHAMNGAQVIPSILHTMCTCNEAQDFMCKQFEIIGFL